jgi:hypothetical protein
MILKDFRGQRGGGKIVRENVGTLEMIFGRQDVAFHLKMNKTIEKRKK